MLRHRTSLLDSFSCSVSMSAIQALQSLNLIGLPTQNLNRFIFLLIKPKKWVKYERGDKY